MTISASIPVAAMEAANATLEAQGFGPGNFSVPLRTGTGAATHAGLHSWDHPAFLAALQAIPGCVVRHNAGNVVNFRQHCAAQALEWQAFDGIQDNLPMTGDERTFDGKTWVSLIDFNVWQPPVGWREVVAEGYPAWIQPTGAQDAYAIGDRVEHANAQDGGKVWVFESKIPANTTQPGTDGTFHRWWQPIELA